MNTTNNQDLNKLRAGLVLLVLTVIIVGTTVVSRPKSIASASPEYGYAS